MLTKRELKKWPKTRLENLAKHCKQTKTALMVSSILYERVNNPRSTGKGFKSLKNQGLSAGIHINRDMWNTGYC
jgi:hypothetical protein